MVRAGVLSKFGILSVFLLGSAHCFAAGPIDSTSAIENTWNISMGPSAEAGNYTLKSAYEYDRNSVNNRDWVNPNGISLDYLHTFQIANTAPLSADTTMSINADDTTKVTDKCAEVFYKNSQAYVKLNTPFNLRATFPGIDNTDPAQPVHITAIPYDTDSSVTTCVAPSQLDASTAIAIWISNPNELIPAAHLTNPIICDLHKTMGTGAGGVLIPKPYYTSALPITAGDCQLDKPEWHLVPNSATAPTAWSLEFTGPLHTMAQENRPIVIRLDANFSQKQQADIRFPITTEYVKYPTALANAKDADTCAGDLKEYNALPEIQDKPADYTQFPYAACKLNGAFPDKRDPAKPETAQTEPFDRSYTYSEPLKQPIYIEGFGRIDGADAKLKYNYNPLTKAYQSYRPCYTDQNVGSISDCTVPGTASPVPSIGTDVGQEYVRYAQWRLDTSLLGLSSLYHPAPVKPTDPSNPAYQGTDPAIYVGGITVADTPKRNRGTVQLNVAQFGQEDVNGGRAADNTPVLVNDFKQVGSWVDASDGSDIGSDKANEQNLYYNVNDDSAKLEANNQYLHNVTLLQGAVGGVMLGMYGVTRDGIDGSVVNGVYVPRIIQKPNQISSWSWYGATHGLISTRTCPRYYQGSAADASVIPGIKNATVENVKVFALSNLTTPSLEPNTLASLVSVGVIGSSIYCKTTFDTKNMAPMYQFGPLNFGYIQSDITPQEPFLFYNEPATSQVTGEAVNVIWGGIHFFPKAALSTQPETSVKYLASKNTSGGDAVYKYACPLNGASKLQCLIWDTVKNTWQKAPSNQNNISVPAGQDVPVTSTTAYPAISNITGKLLRYNYGL